ncbi:CPBP family intramembrane glutamic endopeptidase [Arenimonas composti]|uniref:CAAX prenyl protease 2/Lysostaphin resistance protein A-like domain-containing protein n=1 Tax=Arenimonas composti TR7-09 = DSM 18010 TaxID=1121013 RepID=A0A091BB92_9GAMM|nr:CPBP family intramembrane glutamic endopeptidase [Arenimonas composti]KFN48976.1 hypothetical protein P873_12975 [Arenimonas composti TR7-09 = DSM 18010]
MTPLLPLVAAVFLAGYVLLPLLGVPYAGPLAIVLACATLFTGRRRAGLTLAGLGLARPAPGHTALAAGLALVIGYVAAGVAVLLATQALGWPPPRPGRLAELLPGNLPALLGMLAIAWTTAAFGEELLFRGFLQPRLRTWFGGGRGAALAAVLVQALLFGLAHAYQGRTGMLVSGSIGLGFGLLYLRQRTLWPLVVAHALIDTVGLVTLFLRAPATGTL